MTFHIAGVDPGLVHTGVVHMAFNLPLKELSIGYAVVDGLDSQQTQTELLRLGYPNKLGTIDTFIEWYRPRSGFATDERMVQANASFKADLHGTLVRNTGVKKIVSKDLMELLHVWKFPTATHHQDLRSAARIAVLGMLLDPILNRVVYDYAIDNLEGRDWNVRSH